MENKSIGRWWILSPERGLRDTAFVYNGLSMGLRLPRAASCEEAINCVKEFGPRKLTALNRSLTEERTNRL